MKFPLRTVFAVAALAFVGACSSLPNPFAEKIPPACPRIAILQDAGTITHFTPGGGHDITDIRYSGDIQRLNSLCENAFDKDGAGTMTVQVSPILSLSRGPANAEGTAALAYFVALSSKQHPLWMRRTFPLHITFPENLTRVLWSDDVPVTLTIPVEKGQKPSDFTVYVGFVLSRDEYQYNLKIRAQSQ